MSPKYLIELADNNTLHSGSAVDFGLAQDLYRKNFNEDPKKIVLIYAFNGVCVFETDDIILKISNNAIFEMRNLLRLAKLAVIPTPKVIARGNDYFFMSKAEGTRLDYAYPSMSKKAMCAVVEETKLYLQKMQENEIMTGTLTLPIFLLLTGE